MDESLSQRLARMNRASRAGDSDEVRRLLGGLVSLPAPPPVGAGESAFAKLLRELYHELAGQVLSIQYLAAREDVNSRQRLAEASESGNWEGVYLAGGSPPSAEIQARLLAAHRDAVAHAAPFELVAAQALVNTALHLNRERTMLRLQAAGVVLNRAGICAQRQG